MYRDKLAKGLFLPERINHGHEEGLDKGIVKNVLVSFANPLYVFDSDTRSDSLVAVYDVLDKHNTPIMASIQKNAAKKHIEVNLVTSIYGRKPAQYQRWVFVGLLRYVDDMRKNLPEVVRLQLPSRLEGSYKHKIIYKSQLVNKPGAFFELTDEQRDGFVKKWRTDVEHRC